MNDPNPTSFSIVQNGWELCVVTTFDHDTGDITTVVSETIEDNETTIIAQINSHKLLPWSILEQAQTTLVDLWLRGAFVQEVEEKAQMPEDFHLG